MKVILMRRFGFRVQCLEQYSTLVFGLGLRAFGTFT